MNPFQQLAATDRKAFNQARRAMQKENRTFSAVMVQQPHVPKNDTEPHGVWRSRDFLVMAYIDRGNNLRLSVCRTDLKPDGGWREDISWDDLQRIKRECGYGDQWAVEIFPADEHLVNVANMRHLWVTERPPFGWLNKPVPCATCGGCGMIPGTEPDDDVMNTPCPECNPQPATT